MQYLGEMVNRERARQKMTLKNLADKSGLAISSLCDIEKGRFVPSLESLYKIADALGVPVTLFLPESYDNNVKSVTN
ncbi:MAG: helix-turn-helix transcriptional regulator [Bacillota bacterium]